MLLGLTPTNFLNSIKRLAFNVLVCATMTFEAITDKNVSLNFSRVEPYQFVAFQTRNCLKLRAMKPGIMGRFTLEAIDISLLIRNSVLKCHILCVQLTVVYSQHNIVYICTVYIDRLCGLVVRVLGYRTRCPGFDSRAYQLF
jgi:hypothetical protein